MKYFIIDSLARSGTTLLSALLRSQEEIVTFDGICNEALVTKQGLGLAWPHEIAREPIIRSDKIFIKEFKYYKEKICEQFETNTRASMGLTREEIEFFFTGVEEWGEVDKFYRKLGEKFNASAIGFRWNQCNFYIDQWCNKTYDDHLWITLIRDPRDRLISNSLTHAWAHDDTMETMLKYDQKITEYKDSNKHLIIYYEDLVKEPRRTLKTIFKFLKIKNEVRIPPQLIGSNNQPYRNQGWRAGTTLSDDCSREETYQWLHGEHEKAGAYDVDWSRPTHTKGRKYSGLSTSSIGQYKTFFGPEEMLELNTYMKQFPNIYKRYLI